MHTFRTIEEFVTLLEGSANGFDALGDIVNTSRAETYRIVAEWVRTSNLGIVYPSSDDTIQISFPVKEALAIEALLADREENDHTNFSDALSSAFERVIISCYDVDRIKFSS